jgi:hypothetical protein
MSGKLNLCHLFRLLGGLDARPSRHCRNGRAVLVGGGDRQNAATRPSVKPGAAAIARRLCANRVLIAGVHSSRRVGPAFRSREAPPIGAGTGDRGAAPGELPAIPAAPAARLLLGRAGHGEAQESTVEQLEHDPEKWIPVFGKHHAPRMESRLASISISGNVPLPPSAIPTAILRCCNGPPCGAAARASA